MSSSATASTAPVGMQRSVISNVVRGSLGNLIEWYDWYAYTAFSVYFAKVFFPSGNQTAELLNTAGVFAVGFLMRPVGGWLMGRYADRHGRRAALTLSVTLMAAGSLIIAVTPGAASIGVAAPVILVIARLIQGISLGGEYGSSATYLSEVATPGKRGFYSSFQYVTLTGGQLVALGLQMILQAFLTPAQMSDWGWRIAFVVGAIAAVTVMWLRRTMDESAQYEAVKASGDTEAGTLRLLFRYPKQFFVVVGLTLGGTIAFYLWTTYMQKYMINTAGIPTTTVTTINFIALLLFCVLQPAAGALSDRIGRRPVLIWFGVTSTLLTVPIMTILGGTKSPVMAFVLMMCGLLIVTGYTSINAIVKAELFPAHIRALGVAFPYALTNALFGGTTEYVALGLKNLGHEAWFFFYVSLAGFVSLLVYVFMGESSRSSHIEVEHQGTTARSVSTGLR